VLEIGCGSSEFAIGLHESGYEVVGCDYAEAQINALNKQHKKLLGEGLSFETVDCRQLEQHYSCESFDAVVDKACLDSMLSGGLDTARATCAEVSAVLKPGGHLVVVSHASPEGELGETLLHGVILDAVNTVDFRWQVAIHSSEEMGDEFVHIYVLRKVARAATRAESERKRQISSGELDSTGDVEIERHWH